MESEKTERERIEHPLSIYGCNPDTLRKAWMHFYCFDEAFQQLQYQRAGSIEYISTWIHLV
jgi:hypothetical protein